MNPSTGLYRPNVALLLRNGEGDLLFCERSDWPGTWQFPQGGIAPGECPLRALWREAAEEIALRPDHYRILESRGPYRYLFQGTRKKEGFGGQEQTYFLAELTKSAFQPHFGADPEFRSARWISPRAISLKRVPPLKREVYENVLADFFGIRPNPATR